VLFALSPQRPDFVEGQVLQESVFEADIFKSGLFADLGFEQSLHELGL